eukprot:TRINITY_DN12752_c0_g1_i4.p1 TRINITY_DN12752_c0_g1~~TRINITY_DN12752_c0_g1_i4.p1  ORF type:complete len:109 (-),score=31.40 TRINITY_DN12752_c0_g1_i4:454-780(-)
MIRRPPRSTLSSSSAASDVYKRQVSTQSTGHSLAHMGGSPQAASDSELEQSPVHTGTREASFKDEDLGVYGAAHDSTICATLREPIWSSIFEYVTSLNEPVADSPTST